MKNNKKELQEFSIYLFENINIDQDNWEMININNDKNIDLNNPETFWDLIDDFLKNKDIE